MTIGLKITKFPAKSKFRTNHVRISDGKQITVNYEKP